MNAGYAVGANMPGSLAGNTNTSTASGYVLRMQNLPEGSAKHDIVQVCLSVSMAVKVYMHVTSNAVVRRFLSLSSGVAAH